MSPIGLLFKMYREHFGSIPVEVSGDSPQPRPIFPAGGDQPAVNPGSDTFPLDVSAALTDDRKAPTFAVLNPSDSAQHLKLTIDGVKLNSEGHVWCLARRPWTQPSLWDKSLELKSRSKNSHRYRVR